MAKNIWKRRARDARLVPWPRLGAEMVGEGPFVRLDAIAKNRVAEREIHFSSGKEQGEVGAGGELLVKAFIVEMKLSAKTCNQCT